MRWILTNRADQEARDIADRHYNRQKVGAPQFVPPGRCLVLKIHQPQGAFWVTSYPYARYVKHAWAGAWVCSAFRNESPHLSSELIREAVAATRWQALTKENWDEPDLGMITFVNLAKVKSNNPGFCYLKAGFKRLKEKTKGGLFVLQMLPSEMPEPLKPEGVLL